MQGLATYDVVTMMICPDWLSDANIKDTYLWCFALLLGIWWLNKRWVQLINELINFPFPPQIISAKLLYTSYCLYNIEPNHSHDLICHIYCYSSICHAIGTADDKQISVQQEAMELEDRFAAGLCCHNGILPNPDATAEPRQSCSHIDAPFFSFGSAKLIAEGAISCEHYIPLVIKLSNGKFPMNGYLNWCLMKIGYERKTKPPSVGRPCALLLRQTHTKQVGD